MSAPFSNTHLRVPDGFGTILEGLAREVLRDQPEDIPKYAARYFDALLKRREGVDPEEWAAKLGDEFSNNNGALGTDVARPEKEPADEVTIPKEKSYESQTDDESSHSAETSNLSTAQPDVSEEVDLTGSAEEDEEKPDITEKRMIPPETGLSEKESVDVLPAGCVQPDDPFGTEEEEERDPTITAFHQVDMTYNGSGSASDQNTPPQSKSELTDSLSSGEISHVDASARESGEAEDDRGGEQETVIIDEVIVDSERGEENTDAEEQAEAFPYSGLAEEDVCATGGIRGTEETTEAAAEEDDDGSKSQPEDVVAQSSLPQSPESNLREEAEDQVETTKEEEGTETGASSGGLDESLADVEGGLDSDAVPKEDSLVEISFEDVSEANQQIKEAEEKEPEEEGSVETKILEMQREEESKEVTEVARDRIISSIREQDEPETMEVEKEVNSEGEEMEGQHQESDIMKEEVDVNDSSFNDSKDDDDVKSISSSHQPSVKADVENPDDETDLKNDEKIREDTFHQNEDSEEEAKSNLDFKEDETTDSFGGDKEDVHTEGYSEVEDQENGGGTEERVTQWDASTAAMEGETSEASARPRLEENQSQETPVESQPEDTVEEKEGTSEAGELLEEGKIDSEIQEKSDAAREESIVSPTQSADRPAADEQGQEGTPGSETEPEGQRGDKEECSRPQEEEDIMDIPLDDPEANRAAAKIQAGFRGHMTRKKMKPEDKAEGEEVSGAGDVLNGSQGVTETGGSGAVERDDTSVPEQ